MKKGFTLAEVLITIGIIGVVAALTLPTLISNHQKKVYVTQFKKAYNTVTNAFKLMQAESGSDNLEDNDFISALAVNSSSNEDEVTQLAKKYFNIVDDVKYIPVNSGPEYKYLFYDNNAKAKSRAYLLKTLDGADIYLFWGNGLLYVYFDVNGLDRAPNIVGRDYFELVFQKDAKCETFSSSHNFAFLTCGGSQPDPVETKACALRVIQEGWEMNY